MEEIITPRFSPFRVKVGQLGLLLCVSNIYHYVGTCSSDNYRAMIEEENWAPHIKQICSNAKKLGDMYYSSDAYEDIKAGVGLILHT